MTTASNDRVLGLNEFFAASEARVDRWRTLNRVAKALAAAGPRPAGGSGQDPKALLAELQPLEDLCGYPGPRLMGQVHERLQTGDWTGFARLVQRISGALLSNSYRDDHRALEGRRGGGDPRARHPPPVDRARPGATAVLRDPARLARRAGHVAGDPRDVPAAAARRGRLRVRAGRGRELRGRGPGRGLQPEPAGGRDQRRVRVPLAVHGAGPARDPHPPGAGRRVGAAGRSRDPAGPDGAPVAAGARRLPHDRPRRRPAGGLRRGGADPADLLRGRGADGDPPGDPRRREGPLRDAVLRQSQELRPAPDRHVPRAAGGPREVDLQVQLDPRHGRVLRGQPVPRRVVGDDRRPRQPARADREHQGRAGQGGPRPRRGPQLLRHQRHVDVEQDRPPGGPQAGRHRPDRPRLPQVPPLRARPGGRPAALHRRLPAHAVLDVREPRHQADQEGAPPAQGGREARPREAAGADQLHVRRPRREREADHAGVSRDQAGPHLPLGRGLVRVRPLLAVPPAAHGDGRGGGDPRADAGPGVPEALRGVQGQRRQAGPEGPEARGHGAPAGPGQGARPRLRDRLGAQVDVVAPPGLDHRRRRPGLPHGRALLQGGVLHAHLDLAQSPDHRLARRGAAADGAGGLRARRAGASSWRSRSGARSTRTR